MQENFPVLTIDPRTVELIERVVYDEARGEGIEGRNAVRAVIYNRMAANRRDFGGSSAKGVLNAKGQFQGVWEKGKGNAANLPFPKDVRNSYISEHLEFIQSGSDPTKGATFFLNKKTAARPFNKNQKGTRIGSHEFFDNYNGNKVSVPDFAVTVTGFNEALTGIADASKKGSSGGSPTTKQASMPIGQGDSGIQPYTGKVVDFFKDLFSAPETPQSVQTSSLPTIQNASQDASGVGMFKPYTGELVQGYSEGGIAGYFGELPEGYKTAAGLIADFTPIVGEAKSAYEGYEAYQKGDYGDAALGAVGALPIVGGMVRGARKAGKAADAVSDVFSPLAKSVDAKAATKVEADKVASEVSEGEQFVQVAADLSKAVPNRPPENTVKAYKLFRTDQNKPGEFFPLFVNADKGVPTGTWIDAEVGEMAAKGGVKSKIGELAFRPGWHAGDYASATHIGGKSSPDLKKPDYRRANQVWAEVELPDDVNWQSVADSRASVVKSGPNKGQKNLKEAHITDQVPYGGHYRYKTNSNMQGNWLIGGSMKVNKTLSPKEVKGVEKATGIADLPSLPELISQKGLKLKDLNKESLKELKTYYPDVFKSMGGTPKMFEGGLMDVEDDYESEDYMSCGMMMPEMFDFAVGTDPVSGNPIPPGSNAENVRDDIPAVLSTGEYVVPADVVRYHGLKTFMSLRDEAKLGLMSMHYEGQIQTISDEDLEEPQEEEPVSEDTEEPVVSDEKDSAEEGDEELPEGEYETPEGNMVEVPEVEIEIEGMEVEDESAPEYAKEDFLGDEELIKLFMSDPKAFKRI
jgi:hypothetical protein